MRSGLILKKTNFLLQLHPSYILFLSNFIFSMLIIIKNEGTCSFYSGIGDEFFGKIKKKYTLLCRNSVWIQFNCNSDAHEIFLLSHKNAVQVMVVGFIIKTFRKRILRSDASPNVQHTQTNKKKIILYYIPKFPKKYRSRAQKLLLAYN